MSTEPPAALATFICRHSVHKHVMKDWSQNEITRSFVEYGKIIGVDAFETSREELNDAIRNSVANSASGSIVLADDPLLNELHTVAALETGRTVYVWNTADTRENNIRFAEKAGVGIAVAKMALAESGTVLLFSQNGCGRSVTLLPESVIYIIPKSVIRPRLTQGMEFLRQHKEHMPSSANFVSGPSATSDIELVRVVGVHGPVHVVHIVVHDL